MVHFTDLPPEILELIGEQLDTHVTGRSATTIKHLLCVSRFCHRHFYHLLWRHVSIRGNLPFSDVLKLHAHLVLSLHFNERISKKYYQLEFPGIVSFRCDLLKRDLEAMFKRKICDKRKDADENSAATLSSFLSRHSTIQDLVITTRRLHLSQQLWDTIATTLFRPRLLVIDESTFTIAADPGTKGSGFWRASSRFEEVRYCGSDYSGSLELGDYDFSGLKRLSYSTRTGDSLKIWRWMCSCSNLTRLHWGGTVSLLQLAAVTEHPIFPSLEEFSLGDYVLGSDEELAAVLSWLPPLKHLRLARGNFGRMCFSILRERHFDSLRTLAAQGQGLISKQMALEVLQSCIHLEEFRANTIKLRDLRPDPRHWVCHGLKHLQVTFENDPYNPGASTLLFDQLSTLTRLEVLDMKYYGYSAPCGWSSAKNTPAWRLDSGLAQLSTLTRLRIFKIQKYGSDERTEWRVEDFEWMLDHWPSLEVLCGSFTHILPRTEERVEDRIMALIKQRGVRTF
ncbi:hypothetical protein BGW39_001615 [Mortierella sp. 14UC]|nr:hypothetical protein BGW39_001615 [Mortierella sp. 14UC]